MYKCIEPFIDEDNITWLLGDTIDWVDYSYLTEDEKKNFEKVNDE